MKTRIIALALALVMLITALCACTTDNGNNGDNSVSQDDGNNSSVPSGSVTDSSTKELGYYETPR